MSGNLDVINLYVNRNYIYDLSLSNVMDISRTNITYSIISRNKYENTNEPICQLKNNQLIPYNEGICEILANTTETELYTSGISKTKRIIVSKNNQTPLVLKNIEPMYFNSNIKLDISGGSIDNNLIILSCDSLSCIINNNFVTFSNAGTYNVRAIKYGNYMYNDVILNMTLNILPIQQPTLQLSISGYLNQNNVELYIDRSNPYKLILDGIYENPQVTFSIINTSSNNFNNPICQIINDNTLIAYSSGECILKATTSATNNYLSTDSNQINITVYKNYQNDIILDNVNKLFFKGSIPLNPIGGNTDSSFNFLVKNSGNCSLSGNILYGDSAGECLITINKNGNEIYRDITNDFDVRVNKTYQNNAYIYMIDPSGNFIGKVNPNDTSGNITSGYKLDDGSSYVNLPVNRNIFYQLITGNVSDNAIAKYKIMPRNLLDNDEYLFYYYTFNIDSLNDLQILNNNYTQRFDAQLSISGLISNIENVYGPGILSINNSINNNQYLILKPLLTSHQGITISFWGKMNNSPDKTLFFSFSNGYHNEDIYMGIINNKLFAGYAKADRTTSIFKNVLEFPFENLNNNIWHHIVWAILPEGTWKFYFDGYLLETYYNRAYPTQITRNQCFIGKGVNNIWGNLCMCNFRLYNRSLTDNEVKYICDYTTIYSTMNVGSFYLDTNLKTYYNFSSYACESLSKLNIIKVIPTPTHFTSNSLVITDISGSRSYKNGTYNVSTSSYDIGYEGYLAFNNNETSFWQTSKNSVNNYNYTQDPYNNGLYQGGGTGLSWSTPVTPIGNVLGEWIQIEIPYQIVLTSYSLVIRKGFESTWPIEYVITGFNGTSWENIEYKNLISIPNNNIGIFNVVSTKSYSKFRLIIMKTNGSNNIQLCQWNITGNFQSDLSNINTYRIANISIEGLNYDATLSNKNMIVHDEIIDYVNFNSNTNDYIILDEINLYSNEITNGLSFSFWCRSSNSTTSSSNSVIFSLNNDLSNNINLYIVNNNLHAEVINSNIDKKILDISSTNLNDGLWRHITWVLNGSIWSFYINGNLINTNNNCVFPTLDIIRNNSYIGKGINNYQSLNGSISDFRIYKKILSDTDIINLYKFKLPLFFKLYKNTNLIIYYPLSFDSNDNNNLKISNYASGNKISDGSMSISGLILDKKSQYGNSYANFTSELQYLTLTSFTTIINSLTICFYFRLNSINNNQVIFEFSNNGQNLISCIISDFNDSYFKLIFTVSRQNYPTDKNNYTRYWIWLPFQEFKRWTHISWDLVNLDNIFSTWNIYVDGKLYSIINNTTGNGYYYYPEVINRTTNYIGKSFLPGFNNFIGSVYDFRIYSKELSLDELKYFSTERFFPVYYFNNNQIKPYNYGGLFIQSYINETDNYNFSLSKSLYLNIIKNNQPNFKITSGYGINGYFDGSSTVNNHDGYSNDYLNTPTSGIQPVISAVGSKLYIFSLFNNSNNDSFILETYQSSLLFTQGNSIGSKGTSGDINQYVKIVKIGDYYYNDLTKIYNIYIKKNDRIPFGISLFNTKSNNVINSLVDLLTNVINTYNIKIDRNNPYQLSLTNNYIVDLKEYTVTGDIVNGVQIIQLNNGKLTAVNSGQINIIATVNSSNVWNSGKSIPLTINILKETQSNIIINELPPLYYLSSINLIINGGNSSKPFVLTSDNNLICSINNLTVNGLSVGTCNLIATKGEDEFYYTQIARVNLNVLPIDQDIIVLINELQTDNTKNYLINVNPSIRYQIILNNIMETPIITYITNNNLLNVTTDGYISALNAGNSSITINTSATKNYNKTTKIINFVISKNNQTPLIVDHNNDLYYKNNISINVSGGNSSTEYQMQTDTSNCTISGLFLGGNNSGDCNITIIKPQDFMYKDVSTQFKIAVKLIKQPEMNIVLINQPGIDTSGNTYITNVNETNNIILSLSGVLENPTIFYSILEESFNEFSPICEINNNILRTLNSGMVIIKAITTTTNNYLSSESNILKIIVQKNEQTPLTLEKLPSINFNTEYTLTISGGLNSKNIVLQKQTENCLINGFTIKGTKAGQCYIKAFKDGDYKYNPISLDIRFIILKINQPLIDLSINGLLIVNNQYTTSVNRINQFQLYTINYMENPQITFEILNISSYSDVLCVINNNFLTPYNFGTCQIRAVLSETTNYLSSYSNYITVNFNKTNQEQIIISSPTITDINNCSINFNNVIFLNATGGNIPENQVYYTSSDNSICSVLNSSELKGINSGICIITAIKDGNFMYNPIITRFSVTINKIQQIININEISILNKIFVEDVDYDLTLNGLMENANITFTILSITKTSKFTVDVYSLNGNKIRGMGSGIITLKATTSETQNYLSTDTESITITVTQKKPADFIIDNHLNLYYNNQITITTDNGQKNKDIIFSCDQIGIKINGNDFIGKESGKYNITAKKLETLQYSELVKTFILFCYKLQQKNFAITNTILNYDFTSEDKIILTTTPVNENAKVIFRIIEEKPLDINNNIVAKLHNNILSMVKPGYIKIIAKVLETKNYLDYFSDPITITINKINQPDIQLTNLSDINLNSIYYPKINSIKPYTLTPLTTNCNILNNSITATNVTENCSILINIDGDDIYNSISKTITFKILPINMPLFSLLNINPTNTILLNNKYHISLMNVMENAQITFNIINIDPNDQVKHIDISNNIIIPLSVGNVILQAIANPTINYLQTFSNQIILYIQKVIQKPIITNIPININFNDLRKFTLEGGSVDTPFIFQKSDFLEIIQDINSIYKIKGLKAGNYLLTIIRPGNDIYSDIKLSFNIIVNKIIQPDFTILNFNTNNELIVNKNLEIPIKIVNVQENPLFTYKITNINPVDGTICNLYNDNIIAYHEGICTLEALTLETNNYLPTPSSNVITIKILKLLQPELIINTSGILNFNDKVYLSIIGGQPELEPNIILSNDNIKLINNILLGVKAGTTNILVKKDETELYIGISKQITVTVNKINQPDFILYDINDNNTIYVNPQNKIKLITSTIFETDIINYQVIYSNSTDTSNNTCAFQDNYLIPNNQGEIKIRAYTNETTNYLQTYSNEIIITIIKNNQENLNIICPTNINYKDIIYISGLGGNTNNLIYYNTDTSFCLINNQSITGNFYGNSKIIATKDGDFMYNPISIDFFVNVFKINQIDFKINNINQLNEIEVDPNASFYLTCANVKEGSQLTFIIKSQIVEDDPNNDYRISNNVVCTLTNNILVPLNAGTIIIYATSNETNNYLPTTTPNLNIRVKLKEAIDFKIDNIPNLEYGNELFITTDNGEFNPEISFKPIDNSIAIEGYKLKCLKAGKFVINAHRKGNFMYRALNKKFTVTVNKINQPNFNILNISQQNRVSKYFDILENTDDYYKIIKNDIDIKYVDKYQNGINIFAYTNNTTIYWSKQTGIGFDSLDIKNIIKKNWIIVDFFPISYIQSTNTINILIAGKELNTNNLIIIKLRGNPKLINSYIPEIGYGNYVINDKNLIAGTLENFYCNIKSENHFLLFSNGIFNTRLVDGLSNFNKKLNYNSYVPNLFVSCIDRKGLIIIKDFSNQLITKTSSPSYYLPINDINGKSINGLYNDKFSSGPIYILNTQYIFIICQFDNKNSLLRVDVNNKIIKIIYQDNTNTLWGFDVIDLKTIIIMLGNNYLTTINGDTDSDCYLYDSFNDIYNYNQYNYNIIWKTNNLLDYFTPNPNYKFYCNDRFIIMKNIGLIFFETVNNLKTYTINSPISILYNPVQENARVIIELVSTTSKYQDKKLCYIIKNQIIPLSEGTCTFKAKSIETNNYLETYSSIFSINFELLEQNELNIKNNLDNVRVDDSFELAVDGGNTKSPIIIYSLTDNVQITGYTISCVQFGEAIIALYKEGDEYYKPQIKKINFMINKQTPQLILNDINVENILITKNTYDLVVINVKPNTRVSFNIISTFSTDSNERICYIINKNQLYASSNGVVLLEAVTNETLNYLPGKSNKILLTIKKNKYREIDFKLSNKLLFGKTSYIYDNNDEGITKFIVVNKNKCKIEGNLLTSLETGYCKINGIKEGNNVTESIIQEYTIKVDKIEQTELILNNINVMNSVRVNPEARFKLSVDGVKENGFVRYLIIANYNNNLQLLTQNDANGYIMNDNIFVPIKEGYCEIQAITEETTNYLQTFSNKISIKIVKTNQKKLNITKNGNLYFLGTTQIITIGGSIDKDVIYSINNNNVSMKNNYAFGNRTGKSVITVTKKGNLMYNDISEIYEIEVLKIKQQFFIQNINKTNIIYVDENINIPLKIVNLKENANVQYNIISTYNEGNIAIINNNLLPLYVGEYIIIAQSSETENYLQSQSPELFIKIIKNKQKPLSLSINKPLYYKSSSELICIGGDVDYEETYEIENNNTNCLIRNNTIIGNNTGYCKVLVTKQGNFKYEPIISELIVEVLPIPQQNIKLNNLNINNTINVDPNNEIKLSLVGSEETPTIIYNIIETIPKDISNSDVVIINGHTLYPVNEGICRIQGVTLETHNFIDTQSNIITIIVNKNYQNPLLFNYNNVINFESELIINGSGGSSTGNIIEYFCDSSNCIIKDNSIQFKNIGDYLIKAIKKGNFMYYDIEQDLQIKVLPIKQYNINVTNVNFQNEIEVDLNKQYNLNINNFKETPKQSFKVIKDIPDDLNNRTVCTIDSSNNLIAVNAGTCIIKGYLSETNNYLISETSEYILNVILKSPANFFIDYIPLIPVKSQFAITINDLFDINIYDISCNEPKLQINNNIIFSNYASKYKLTITKKATFEYKSISKNFNVIISKLNQPDIIINNLETNIFVSSTKAYNLSLNNMFENAHTEIIIIKNLPTLNNNNVCIISNNTLYALSEGICYIKAIVYETLNYNQKETDPIKIIVKRKDQIPLTFNNPFELKVNETLRLNILGGSTNEKMIFNSQGNNCFINNTNNIMTGLLAGIINVSVTLNGNDEYKSTTINARFTIYKNYQTVNLENINRNNQIFVGDIAILLISKIKENARVRYIISDIINDEGKNSICNISNNQIIATDSGTCSIQGILTETNNYYETRTNKIYIKIIKKQQDKLIVNGKTTKETYIKTYINYKDSNYINIGGGNTNKIKIEPVTDKCKVLEIN
jgi:hypothetical protein